MKEATDDDTLTDAWYEQHPEHGIGISGDGFVIFDFDVKDGIDGRDQLLGWDLPDTLCQTTPSGGYHMIYRTDEEIRPSVNSAIAVDVRGWHSYIVCDPTPGYCFEDDEVAIADADDTVMRFLESVRPSKRGSRPLSGGSSIQGTDEVKTGGRNDYLFSQGRSMRARSIAESEIRAYLHMLNKLNCKPPLPDFEVEKIFDSVVSVQAGLSEEAKEIQKANSQKTAKHVSVAQAIMNQHSGCFLDGAPAVFDGLSYRIGWDAVERVILKEWPNAKDRERKEVIKYLTLTMPKYKQSEPKYIGFANGVLDIETMELLAFSPDLRIPNVIPHDWNPSARSEIVDNTLRKIACNDPFIENNLCEFIGLSMFRSAKYAFAAILLGKQSETASNGKSTYIDMIRAVIGEDNYSSLSLHVLGERFYQDYLAGKLANLGDDISSSFTKGQSLEVFKKAVSGSELTTDVKGTKGYKFTPYCTMIFSANEFPKLENLDDGVLRRLFPIRFNAHFTPDDDDFDPDIGDKLKRENAIEAAIVRGVWGLKRVIKNRRPTDNDESKRMVADIRVNNSNILQWIADEDVDRDDLIETSIGHVYERYEEWCKSSGVKNKFAKWQFSKEICNYYKFRVRNTTRENKSIRILVDA